MDGFDDVHDDEKTDEDEEEAKKGARISLHLIARRNLPNNVRTSQEEIIGALNRITHLRLDREKVQFIDNLELLGNAVKYVYLQQNRIEKIENLESLQNLTFLMMAGNRIKIIENLIPLKNLKFLNLSENQLETVDVDEIPPTVTILNLKGNPCTNLPDYRGRLIQDLPNLSCLDDMEVTKQEKRDVGFVVSDSDDEDENNGVEEDDDDDTDYNNVKGIFKPTTEAIISRSKQRKQEVDDIHKQRNEILEEIREESVQAALQTARSLKECLTERSMSQTT